LTVILRERSEPKELNSGTAQLYKRLWDRLHGYLVFSARKTRCAQTVARLLLKSG
jgi:hypothetical protein